MAEVDVKMTSAAEDQKRKFAADVTNKPQGKTQRKKPKQDPKELVRFEWSDVDMASSKARVDATILARECRRPYDVTTAVQERHAPKSLPQSAAFYEHEGADAVAAVQARRSGAAPSAPAGRLAKRPLWGGISSRKNAPLPPANIVGVHEINAANGKLGCELQQRKKQMNAAKMPGSTLEKPSFQIWRKDKEIQEASPWYTGVSSATLADCKRRWPNVAKKHPDFETTKMTYNLLSALSGRNVRKLCKSEAEVRTLANTVANTNWKLEWKKLGA